MKHTKMQLNTKYYKHIRLYKRKQLTNQGIISKNIRIWVWESFINLAIFNNFLLDFVSKVIFQVVISWPLWWTQTGDVTGSPQQLISCYLVFLVSFPGLVLLNIIYIFYNLSVNWMEKHSNTFKKNHWYFLL